MAQKNSNSRADRAVKDANKKSSKTGTASKNSGKKSVNTTPPEPPVRIPAEVLIPLVCVGLFVLFLVIALKPEGVLLKFIKAFVTGLLGQAGFYFSIPALLYIFISYTFCRKAKLKLRSICTVLFVFLCGVMYHLVVQRQILASGFALFTDLYLGGGEGSTGGVLCGGFAMLLRLICGNIISYILTALGIVVMLLGAMEITIPSLIKAIRERPRADWVDDEPEDYIEPAAIVVNHFANKQIEHKRQKRERKAVVLSEEQPHQHSAPAAIPEPRKPVREKINPQSESVPLPTPRRNREDFMSQIELDVSAPVGAAASEVTSAADAEIVIERSYEETPPVIDEFAGIPKEMPQLKNDPPVLVARKKDGKKKSDASEVNSADTKVEENPRIAKKVTVKEHKLAVEEKPDKVTRKDAAESAQQVAQEIADAQTQKQPEYCFPPIDLLKKPAKGGADGTDEMRENSRRLNETLASFKIDAHIINVTRGPSVTRYEVELDKGVRLSKLTGCADDIALSLGASGVRIAAVPGKISVVGIEVPNRAVTTVSLREVIDSNAFAQSKSKSSFAVGKDIGGSCIVGNISKMPHMLIAGTTGSGKSVCMNSIIISLLYKAGPEDVKLIMVDPKMVELGIYNSIPHLLIPVVTDPKKAAGSLQWAVTEMLRRYKMMSDAGVRDLESYNSIVCSEGGQKLPQIVIIIDELADLMLVAAKEVEDSICRVAQMGRAAGMHLIIATQRPSADVITGLMKANIPSRIAFSVASAMESRIILDTQGAEKLVGKGDMLYAPIGSGKPLRVQGCFVTDGEVEAVASYVKENYVSDYNEQILKDIEQRAQQTGKSKPAAADQETSQEELEGDEMLPAAVDVILETGQASVSMLQRRLKLGYARAARIVDEMEEKGIVGPFQGSKPRAILVTKEQWAAMRGGQSEQLDFDDLSDTTESVVDEE